MLDLFDRRYEIFMDVWNFLSRPSSGRKLNSLEYLAYINEFQAKIPIASFLFGTEITSYMKEAVKKHYQYRRFGEEFDIIGHLSSENNSAYEALVNWFSYEARDGVRKKFDPFLSLKHLK